LEAADGIREWALRDRQSGRGHLPSRNVCNSRRGLRRHRGLLRKHRSFIVGLANGSDRPKGGIPLGLLLDRFAQSGRSSTAWPTTCQPTGESRRESGLQGQKCYVARMFVMAPALVLVAKELETFKDFPRVRSPTASRSTTRLRSL
jgi:hypothetical protein